MKRIQKKISLEQFKSRMPSTIPAFYKNGDFYEFNGKDNVDSNGNIIPYTNYNLIPFSVLWGKGIYKDKTISYHNMSKWFHFIENYLNLLTSNGCLEIAYISAEEAIKYEDTEYSANEAVEMDNKIKEICGNDGSSLFEAAKETYEYMIEKYFPLFKINDKELQKNWNKKSLSINEVNYWINWFSNIVDIIGDNATISDCPNKENCCECERFFNLGGYEMLNNLKMFINNLTYFPIEGNYSKPYFSINISLSTSIDDLGEFSVLNDNWEGGINYSVSEGKNIDGLKITSGAIVSYNYQDWVLNNGDGYIYSNEFKDHYFGNVNGMTIDERNKYNQNSQKESNKENQFERLIERRYNEIMNNNEYDGFDFNRMVNDGDCYTFNYKNERINFTKPLTIKTLEQIYNSSEIITSELGFYYVKDEIYEVSNYNYLTFINVNYELYYDTEENPFVIIGNNRYNAIFDEDESKFLFIINGKKYYARNGNGIIFMGKLFIENNDILTIGSKKIKKIKKYFIFSGEYYFLNDNDEVSSLQINDDSVLVLVRDDRIFGQKKDLTKVNESEYGYAIIEDDTNQKPKLIYIILPFRIYDGTKITAYTESKLSSFVTTTDVVHDNLGNKLPGTLALNNGNIITENTLLDLMYKPDTVIHLSQITDNNGDIVPNTFWGDYLKSIELYYSDNNGNALTSKHSVTDTTTLSEIINQLDDELNDVIEKFNDGVSIPIEGLKCEFTYYMGCTIINQNNVITLLDEGIKYTDITKLEKKKCKYFLDDYTLYYLQYYDIVHDMIYYHNDTYNFNSSVPKAIISFNITRYTKDDNFICNGWVDFPVFREEYKLGSSSLENVKSDIYIDRGVSRAFDNHLKLLEVNSLESLEQYGNGYFNIINN